MIAIREITHELVPAGTNKHGPVVCVRRLRCEFVASEAWARVLSDGARLSEHRGAGPCGTRVEELSRQMSPLGWSVLHLIGPLRVHYVTYREPLHFGAKQGPRGRKAA